MSATKSSTVLSASRLATVAKQYVRLVDAAEGKSTEAAVKAAQYVLNGGKQLDLTLVYGVTKGTVSKHVTLGKCIALVGDQTPEVVAGIKATLTSDQGDRPALVKALAAKNAAGVVAASKAPKPVSSKRKTSAKSKSKASKPVVGLKFSDLHTAALVSHIDKAIENLAGRGEEVAPFAEDLKRIAKFATLLGKNAEKMVLA